MKQAEKSKFNQIVRGQLLAEKWNFAVAVFCTVGMTLAELLKPWALKLIVDNILLNKPLPAFLSFAAETFSSQKTTSIVLVASLVVVVSAIKGFSGFAQSFITSRIGYRLAHTLRRELFTHLQRLSLSFHKRSETGELLSKITNDTNNLRDTFSEFALQFATDLLTLCGMVTIMFLLNLELSLIVLATFPFLAAISVYRFRRIRASARRQRKAEGQIATRASEVLSSMLVVQAFGRERYEEEKFGEKSAATLDESIKTARLESASARSVDFISAVGTFFVLVVGSTSALRGEITPGSVLVFVSYMNSIYSPIRSIAKLSSKISRAFVSAGRVAEILNVEPEIKDAPDAIEARNLSGDIEFQNVSFDYGNGKTILQDISFCVPAGKKVALLGASGAGKTTIISLILRLYDATGGAISIDGVNIKKFKRESLRREIGIVLQDAILFGATVRENIAYGKPDATDTEIIQAAKSANAHDFIEQLPDGYDTVIGERGGTLSGGQRQRLTIARAFIRDAQILILDEPMTGLDTQSEAAIRDAMERLMRGKTCILITHDLPNAAFADWILMLENGRIAEQGTPEKMSAQSKNYQTLLQKNVGATAAMRTAN
jgi:ATP-binding cassette, subfamily B, bacterial